MAYMLGTLVCSYTVGILPVLYGRRGGGEREGERGGKGKNEHRIGGGNKAKKKEME